MKCYIKFFATVALAVMVCSCRSKEISIKPYYTFETECLGNNLDGTILLRAWGRGRNLQECREQAKKQAVREVIFKGILRGTNGCDVRPLLTEVNAYEKYRPYFDKFFRDGGAYDKYVELSGSRKKENNVVKGDLMVSADVSLRILYSELRDRLISDNILKP